MFVCRHTSKINTLWILNERLWWKEIFNITKKNHTITFKSYMLAGRRDNLCLDGDSWNLYVSKKKDILKLRRIKILHILEQRNENIWRSIFTDI